MKQTDFYCLLINKIWICLMHIHLYHFLLISLITCHTQVTGKEKLIFRPEGLWDLCKWTDSYFDSIS